VRNDQANPASLQRSEEGEEEGPNPPTASAAPASPCGQGVHPTPPLQLACGIHFHLYTSQAPCGDAAIFADKGETESIADTCVSVERARADRSAPAPTPEERQVRHEGEPCKKRARTTRSTLSPDPPATTLPPIAAAPSTLALAAAAATPAAVDTAPTPLITALPDADRTGAKTKVDIHRTGAKAVPTGPQDPMVEGGGYHVLGALRTKPGRGCPSHSMSCTDKITRWTVRYTPPPPHCALYPPPPPCH
jgi:tRNA-specific adenosine deaminase 1